MTFDIDYRGLQSISGPLVFVQGIRDVGLGEIVELRDSGGDLRMGQVLEVDEDRAVVQVFEGTSGLSLNGTDHFHRKYTGDPGSPQHAGTCV